jgi:hypothetical protein
MPRFGPRVAMYAVGGMLVALALALVLARVCSPYRPPESFACPFVRPVANVRVHQNEYGVPYRLFDSHERSLTDPYTPYTPDACRRKCDATAECTGFGQDTDGECQLYARKDLCYASTKGADDAIPTTADDTTSTPFTLLQCNDTPPATYPGQGTDLRVDCAGDATCRYLGSPACAEGQCMRPYKSGVTRTCTQAWEALLDRFPHAVDGPNAHLTREAFLRRSCDGSVSAGQPTDGVDGTDDTCAPA